MCKGRSIPPAAERRGTPGATPGDEWRVQLWPGRGPVPPRLAPSRPAVMQRLPEPGQLRDGVLAA
jgi:hypothetical protein